MTIRPQKRQRIGRITLILSSLILLADCSQTARADEWDSVKSWVYQLTNYKDGNLRAIVNADYDLAVIELARDGDDG